LGRILAIDFGLKRTGIAVTDPLQIIAGGLTTVSTNDLMIFLKDYVVKENVETIVIGYPYNQQGTQNQILGPIDRFISSFEKKFPAIPVIKEDERYTSKIAVQTMVEGGLKKMKRRNKELIDKVSATIILQSYLESLQR
jgi:putative holliday junction resolvase